MTHGKHFCNDQLVISVITHGKWYNNDQLIISAMTYGNDRWCVPFLQEKGDEEKEIAKDEDDNGANDEVILKMCTEYTLYVDGRFCNDQLVIFIMT